VTIGSGVRDSLPKEDGPCALGSISHNDLQRPSELLESTDSSLRASKGRVTPFEMGNTSSAVLENIVQGSNCKK
jgi:hypothetical protein